MPVPGQPRNPLGEIPGTRFHRVMLPVAGRDQKRRVRDTLQEPGTLRRVWRNLAGYIGANPPFSWTANGHDRTAMPVNGAVTTPLRYLISTRDIITVGNQLSRPMKRPALTPRVAHTPPSLVMAGNVGYRPTVRSRVPSFSSRVPALNSSVPIITGTEVQ